MGTHTSTLTALVLAIDNALAILKDGESPPPGGAYSDTRVSEAQSLKALVAEAAAGADADRLCAIILGELKAEIPSNVMTPAERIKAAAQLEGRRLYPDYSGRCMFGKTCLGIVCADGDTSDVISDVRVPGARTDNLGRGWIVYWPSVPGEPRL